jgi:hypothetical protein
MKMTMMTMIVLLSFATTTHHFLIFSAQFQHYLIEIKSVHNPQNLQSRCGDSPN